MQLKRRDVFVSSPRQGVLCWAFSWYAQRDGARKMRYAMHLTRSDTVDAATVELSDDHGDTWRFARDLNTGEHIEGGTIRRHPRAGWVDPRNDRMILLTTQGVLPTDYPLEGMKRWRLRYAVSLDAGRTLAHEDWVIQKGGHTAENPIDGVWYGRNGFMIGDFGCQPILTRGGAILVPFQLSPLGVDGQYDNPGGGLTYHESGVLIGSWRDQTHLEWDLGETVRNSPGRSTRGCVEPTIAQFPDGRVLMVMRGSNDAKPWLPGRRWFSVSRDEGRTWSPVEPWTFSDGKEFFSPSSMSQLLWHSNGQCYWLGNISPVNPRGNLPRKPLVIARVDPASLRPIRESVFVVDDGQPTDRSEPYLSNFMAHEDRRNGDILLNMSRLFAQGEGDWTSDAYLYRIAP